MGSPLVSVFVGVSRGFSTGRSMCCLAAERSHGRATDCTLPTSDWRCMGPLTAVELRPPLPIPTCTSYRQAVDGDEREFSMNVRLGSIGLGWWGNELASAATRTGTAEVVACFAPPARERALFVEKHGCAEATELDDLLSDPEIDGVLIATPHSTHADLIVQAAQAGKHVYVEKPLTLTVVDADRAIAACKAAGVVLQVGHNRRRSPANRTIKTMIDRGDLGQVLFFEATHSFPILFMGALGWRANPAE